ncbi:hypothetical protein BC343_10355 [Mucilaginibacter pedocola]|uniref:N-acetyltransferase domain-containing protein n=1 Tax=Mucilaginibacter pedocola TaxID=1792845 RepID=A0A1S9PCP3_9SPHI|nr:hypothetical protein BC343_10355 [Mucilaginibacter pedocola]
MLIRNYRSADHDALAQIYIDSRSKTFYWLNTWEYTLDEFDTDTHGEKIWLAELDGAIAGFIAIWEPDNFVHHLYVDSQYVGKGVGKALLTSAMANYSDPLKLKCLVKNQNAHAFYLSRGWVVTGEGVDTNGTYWEMASR